MNILIYKKRKLYRMTYRNLILIRGFLFWALFVFPLLMHSQETSVELTEGAPNFELITALIQEGDSLSNTDGMRLSELHRILLENVTEEEPEYVPQLTLKVIESTKVISERNGLVQLQVKMYEFGDAFKQLEISINGEMVIKKKINGCDIATEIIPLQLSPGQNMLEVIVENQSGVRSVPQDLVIDYKVSGQKQRVLYSGIGISTPPGAN